jgi:Holliday junction resolvasome RuvABC endonuclease subunit
MLHVPENSRPTFTIAASDPGTHNLGLGVLHVDMLTYRIRSFEAYTIVATKLMHDDDMLVDTHGHTFARTEAHKKELIRRLQLVRPSAFACEDAYFNRGRPGAYGPLLMSINAIRQAVLEYNRFMPFKLIEASVVKNAVGAKGGSNKVSVLEAISKLDEFKVPTSTPLSGLSEHAIDGLAIAYARLKQMR